MVKTEEFLDKAKDELGTRSYILIVQEDDGSFSGAFNHTYADGLGMLNCFIKGMLNYIVPFRGYSVYTDIMHTVEKAIKNSTAKPTDETEAALNKLRSILKQKHEEYTGEKNG